MVKVRENGISSQRETKGRNLKGSFPTSAGCQEVNIFLSLERNPSLFSPASGLALLPAELSMVLPPGHKQQKELGSGCTPPRGPSQAPPTPTWPPRGSSLKEPPHITLRGEGTTRSLAGAASPFQMTEANKPLCTLVYPNSSPSHRPTQGK